MRSVSIVDAGPLYAVADAREPRHADCLALLRRRDLDLVIPGLVVTEVAQLIEKRLGPAAEAAFLRGLRVFEIEAPLIDEWPLIADLVERYGDFPLARWTHRLSCWRIAWHGLDRHPGSPSLRAVMSRRAGGFASCRTAVGSRRDGAIRGLGG